jgi:hypothetical protein
MTLSLDTRQSLIRINLFVNLGISVSNRVIKNKAANGVPLAVSVTPSRA